MEEEGGEGVEREKERCACTWMIIVVFGSCTQSYMCVSIAILHAYPRQYTPS